MTESCDAGLRNQDRWKGRVDADGRECSRCGLYKLWGEFSPSATRTGHYSDCKECRRVVARVRRAANPEAARAYARAKHLAAKYGITPEQYAWLAELQGDKCALCLQPETQRRRPDRHGVLRVVDLLGIDHDHACGRHSPDKACIYCIRGLLCDDCNRMLGFAERKVVVAFRFTDYLEQRPLLLAGKEDHPRGVMICA